ncbi:MAG: radical SAM protein [Patescibacteria group bacterium]|jgi:radical SAM protein with 4Fe4S-binding SPASM domain
MNHEKIVPHYSENRAEDIGAQNQQIIQKKEGKLQFTSAYVDLNGGCNFKCEGCFKHMNMEQSSERLQLEQIKEIVNFVKERGGESIAFAGQGEPLMDRDFWEVTEYIKERGLESIVFTNGTLIRDNNDAEKLLQSGSVIIKRNTLNDALQDKLVGVEGASKMIQHGLDALFEAREKLDQNNEKHGVLGIDTYVIKDNLDDLPDLLRYCRRNGVIPYFEAFIELGQTKDTVEKLGLTAEELTKAFLVLQRIDKEEFNMEIPVVPGMRTYGQPVCSRGTHMFSVRVNGEIYPCISAVNNPLGTIYDDDGAKRSLEKVFAPGNEKLKRMFCAVCSKRVQKKYCQ